MQRHPFKQQIMHLDFQRVDANEALRASVPLHFLNQDKSPAGKTAEWSWRTSSTKSKSAACRRTCRSSSRSTWRDLKLGDAIHLSDLKLPEGVEIPELKLGKEHDVAVVSAKLGRTGQEAPAPGRGRRSRRGRPEEVSDDADGPAARSARPLFARSKWSALRLIVGLGNPGPEHSRQRHNAGFWFVDALARKHGGQFRIESKLFGEACKVDIGGHAVWLLKPATFMNLSGKSVTAALRFCKIEPEEALLAHDELDLPPGTARLKFDGGHGGQNGLRDTMRLLGHGNSTACASASAIRATRTGSSAGCWASPSPRTNR